MTESRIIAIAAEDDRGLGGQVSSHFGRCPFFVLAEADASTVTSSRVIRNPSFEVHHPGVVPRFIRDLGANVIIAGGMGPRAIDLFHGFGIDVATGTTGTVEQVLGAYLSGEHRGVVPCAHDHPESCGGDGQHGGRGHAKNRH
ncbi:NifB/NifX family molybdenum-iron cluster-binding protein [bacterium]|nr:NifB/NifX family molybdenum-iron cluster-binding protein [bacterium]